ncbi:MAG: hypothetical protein M1839_008556 [Geoglossum umbratile]|nr:MAG: hypothetical protein M1839_008556 [Geoglossum umbratile]
MHDRRNSTGVYTQWITSFLANRYVADEISGSLDANSIFLLALLTAMLRNTIQGEQITLLDGLVLIQLCFGYMFSVFSLFGYRTRLFGKQHFPILGTYIRLFLAGTISAYTVWFWFDGAEHLEHEHCGPPVMFFFGKFVILGRIKYLWKVVAILCAMYFFTVFLAGLFAFLVWVGALIYAVASSENGIREEWDHFWEIAMRKEPEAPVNTAQAKRVYNILSVLNLIAIPWYILSIELVLNWNHMTGVTGTDGLSGTGQLIPALIGMCGLVRILWIIAVNNMNEKAAQKRANIASDSQGDSPGVPKTLHRARTITFQLNNQVLLNIISLQFIIDMLNKRKLTSTHGGEAAHGNGENTSQVPSGGGVVVEVTQEGKLDSGISPA